MVVESPGHMQESHSKRTTAWEGKEARMHPMRCLLRVQAAQSHAKGATAHFVCSCAAQPVPRPVGDGQDLHGGGAAHLRLGAAAGVEEPEQDVRLQAEENSGERPCLQNGESARQLKAPVAVVMKLRLSMTQFAELTQ